MSNVDLSFTFGCSLLGLYPAACVVKSSGHCTAYEGTLRSIAVIPAGLVNSYITEEENVYTCTSLSNLKTSPDTVHWLCTDTMGHLVYCRAVCRWVYSLS